MWRKRKRDLISHTSAAGKIWRQLLTPHSHLQGASPAAVAEAHPPDTASSASSTGTTLLLGGASLKHNENKPLEADAGL